MNEYNRISIQTLDNSSIEQKYLLICDNKYYEANKYIVELLSCLQKEANISSAIYSFQNTYNYDINYDDVLNAIKNYIDSILNDKKNKSTSFIWHKEILGAKAVEKYSKYLSFLFSWKYIIVTLSLAIIFDTIFFMNTGDIMNFNNIADFYNIIGLLIFVLLSSLLHEFGHAAACNKSGIHQGGIGIGLYLNFPVLYTDVTAIWKLPRKQRCMVNLAGVYFQSFVLIALIIANLLYSSDLVRYMILTINLGMLFTLNPFFKFDGYWIATDLLGIPNLRARAKEFCVYLYYKIKGKQSFCIPYFLSVKKTYRICFVLYSIVVNLFMAYYFFYIIPVFLCGFISKFPDEMHQLLLYLSCNIPPSFALVRNISSQILLFFLIAYLLYCKLIRPVYFKWIKK